MESPAGEDFGTLWITYHSFKQVRTIKQALFYGDTPFKELHVGLKLWEEYNVNGCILEYQGVQITHRDPILTYVAKLAGLYPKADALSAAKLDDYREFGNILTRRSVAYFMNEKDKNAEAGVIQGLTLFCNRWKELGSGKWLMGDKMTIADLELQNLMRHLPKKMLGITMFRKFGKEFEGLNRICHEVSQLDAVKKVDEVEYKLLSGADISSAGGLRETIKMDPVDLEPEKEPVDSSPSMQPTSSPAADDGEEDKFDDMAIAAKMSEKSSRTAKKAPKTSESSHKSKKAEHGDAESPKKEKPDQIKKEKKEKSHKAGKEERVDRKEKSPHKSKKADKKEDGEKEEKEPKKAGKKEDGEKEEKEPKSPKKKNRSPKE